ncbi:MAG: hypothetical protein WKF40_09285 [Thermoleophilaceae bacterium]
MKEDGCKSVHIFNDKTTYGAGLASQRRGRRQEAGHRRSTGNDGTDRNAAELPFAGDQRSRPTASWARA